MSYEYFFTREMIPDDGWDINNKFRVDDQGNQILLANEVENLLPGKLFKLSCKESEVKFEFQTELNNDERIILNNAVQAHKSNT